jgi:uracil-DNA glycosylase family 4
VFTGDSSGDWLYRTLHETGFANRPESSSRDDGLQLTDAIVSCAVRCAPPQNRPSGAEKDACRAFLVEELRAYRRLAVVIALGRIAFDALGKAWSEAERPEWEQRPSFGHGREVSTAGGEITLISSYHPSRQNTQTGRLTRGMFRAPFRRAREILDSAAS